MLKFLKMVKNERADEHQFTILSSEKLTGTLVPDELILEILSRTPVKDLIRLRCVSKSWLALTVDPQFIHMHLTRNAPINKGILFRGYAPNYTSEIMSFLRINESPCTLFKLKVEPNQPRKFDHTRRFEFSRYFYEMAFCGSVNGIVCLSHYGRDSNSGNLVEWEQFAVLWNPAIRRCKPILLPTRGCFDDDLWIPSVGLGFNADANDFKIFRIVPVRLGRSLSRVEIYSANLDSWNRVQRSAPFLPRSPNCNFIVKGVPYWIDADTENLLAIDPCTEKHRMVPYPMHVKNQSTSVHPMTFMDSVALLIYSPGMDPNNLVDVYILDESCDYWIKKRSTQPIVGGGLWRPKCLTDGGLVVEAWEGLALYSPSTYDTTPSRFSAMFDAQCYSHVESLVCLNGMEPLTKKENKKKKNKVRVFSDL
ncbi:hypothetical protein AgCh_039787 [Apium graveolens]